MKKVFIILAGLFMSMALFAEDYEVKSVTGKVTLEASKGKAETVAPGMILNDESVITLGANSKLVISVDGKDITLRTPKKETLAEFIEARNQINGSSAKKGKGTATAASRASDVMAEGELDD
ncbi:MAG: hypothetical protein J5780_00570 [Treponema sp.]|nr:hypothetical protein [Treponema sp.]